MSGLPARVEKGGAAGFDEPTSLSERTVVDLSSAALSPAGTMTEPFARRQRGNGQFTDEVSRIPAQEGVEAGAVLFHDESDLGIFERHLPFHPGQQLARRGSRESRIVAAAGHQGDTISASEIDVQLVEARHRKVEAQDATDLEEIENTRHPSSLRAQAVERAAVHAVMDVIGVAEVDDEDVGVEEDHRLPRLWSSASFHDAK